MDNDPQMLGTRVWLQELREICERHFDNRAEGQRFVRSSSRMGGFMGKGGDR